MTLTAPRTRPGAMVARDVARVETRYVPGHALDLLATVNVHRRGAGDPAMQVYGDAVWRTAHTPEGVGTIVLRQVGGEIRAAAWGAGAHWLIGQLPRLCGADDAPENFDARGNALIEAVHHRNPGLRLSASDLVSDSLVSAILEQKVTGMQAFGAWRWLVRKHGTLAPGPTPRPMYAAPPIETWRSVPSWDWHRAGVEPPQSRTAVAAARRGSAYLDSLTDASREERDRMLLSQRGIGPWTSAEVRIRAFGDADAVSVGDFHLAHHVGYALTGARTDDAGMLALLEPWAGQRQRVIRLIARSGVVEPRKAPRLHPEDHRDR